uniref:Uncharacterized protein n=1 Tax=Nonomuraea gerenzanensis TaxID=93944 RepID=A0A1M4EDF3_9ACTN|nr:hypothetical protein BN4615_P6330 [Nonomuraea gerenzanensis]
MGRGGRHGGSPFDVVGPGRLRAAAASIHPDPRSTSTVIWLTAAPELRCGWADHSASRHAGGDRAGQLPDAGIAAGRAEVGGRGGVAEREPVGGIGEGHGAAEAVMAGRRATGTGLEHLEAPAEVLLDRHGRGTEHDVRPCDPRDGEVPQCVRGERGRQPGVEAGEAAGVGVAVRGDDRHATQGGIAGQGEGVLGPAPRAQVHHAFAGSVDATVRRSVLRCPGGF